MASARGRGMGMGGGSLRATPLYIAHDRLRVEEGGGGVAWVGLGGVVSRERERVGMVWYGV